MVTGVIVILWPIFPLSFFMFLFVGLVDLPWEHPGSGLVDARLLALQGDLSLSRYVVH